MSPALRIGVLLSMALASVSTAASGEYPSIDALVDRSPTIVIARANQVKLPGYAYGGDQYPVWKLDLKVVERLKGTSPDALSLTRTGSPGEKAQPMKVGSELLLFLDTKEAPAFVVFLDHPNLQPPEAVVTSRFELLETREGIEAAVRGRLQRPPPREWLHLSISLGMPKSPVLKDYQLLLVPADPEHRERFIEEARSPAVEVRAEAAKQLAYYPGATTVQVLKGLLTDEGTILGTTGDEHSGTIGFKYYVVRRRAWESLTQLGVLVPQPADGAPSFR